MGKTKLRAWAALLTSVVLLGSSIHVTNAEEVVDTYAEDEESGTGTPSNTDTTLTSLILGDTDKSGAGWNYAVSTHTLSITDDVTVEGSTRDIIYSSTDLTINVAANKRLTVTNSRESEASYGIHVTGNLNINVAENAALSVKNSQTNYDSYGIYATGNITLSGQGNIDITVPERISQPSYGICAENAVTISNSQLSVCCATNGKIDYAIRAKAGMLTIENANVYAAGECCAGSSGSYPISILGNSIVNIESRTNEGSSSSGLRGSKYTFSDQAHVKISSSQRVIGDKDGNLTLAQEPTTGYYWRTENTDSGWKTTSCSNSSGGYVKSSFFEYIGSAHVSDKFVSSGNGKHSKNCSCTDNPTTITFDCSGGEATCTERAICSVCGAPYGDQATNHDFNTYHICTKCGEVKAGVATTVTIGNKTRGYMKEEIDNAITYAVSQQGSVVKLYPDWSADTIKIDDSNADFTIDLNGQNMSNGVKVNAGTVTIMDSTVDAAGKIWGITIGDKGTVSLESGTVDGNVAVEGGIFNVNGGMIATIYFDVEGGLINWNSKDASVTNMILCRTESGSIMEMNQVPNSPLTVKLDGNYDLSQPFAGVKSGITIPDNIFSIGLWFDAFGAKYNLETERKGSQLFARFPLNQTNSEDQLGIELDASGYVYDGSAKEPKVTVTRKILEKYTGGSPSNLKDVTLPMDGNYTVSYSDNTNAGTAKVTIKGIGCYTGSVERTFTIAKAAPEKSSIAVDMRDRTYSCRTDNADQVDLTPYLPKDCGTVTATAISDGNVSYSNLPKVTKGILSYTIKQSDSPQSGTITVTVSTTNYEDFTITVPITTKDLGIVHPKDGTEVALQNHTLTEGEKLSKLTFKDVVFVDENDTEVPGTLSWQTPDAVPALGTTSAQWVFQPEASDKYAPLSGSIAITVQKKSDAGSGSASSGGGSIGGGGGGGAAAVDPKTDDPKQDDSKTDDPKTDDTKTDGKTHDTKQDAKTPASKGTKLKTSSGVSYQVISASAKAPKVTYRAAQKKAKGTVTVPKTVTIKGVRYQVTAIAAGAFSGCKNVKHIVIPSSITAIGENAFADCAKLKTITINTTKLSSKNVADGAFDGIADGTVIRVPKRMLAKYQKLFEKKGLSDKVKLVAIKAKKK